MAKWLRIGLFTAGLTAITIIVSRKVQKKLEEYLINPVIGNVYQKFSGTHNGVDIPLIVGTPIKAPGSGIVQSVYYNTLGGNQLIIYHPLYGLHTGYAHLSSIPVSVGQLIKQGDIIAYSGNTGYSTGPHLHFVVRENLLLVDPEKLFTFKA